MIRVNMDKARDIKRNMIRAERADKFTALDVAFMVAVESGDKAAQAQISNKKKALRDCTQDPAIEAAQTPEELKAVRPQALDM